MLQLAFLQFPQEQWPKIWKSNPLERLNVDREVGLTAQYLSTHCPANELIRGNGRGQSSAQKPEGYSQACYATDENQMRAVLLVRVNLKVGRLSTTAIALPSGDQTMRAMGKICPVKRYRVSPVSGFHTNTTGTDNSPPDATH